MDPHLSSVFLYHKFPTGVSVLDLSLLRKEMKDDRRETVLAAPRTGDLSRLRAQLSPGLTDLLNCGGGIFPQVRDLDYNTGQTAASLKTALRP